MLSAPSRSLLTIRPGSLVEVVSARPLSPITDHGSCARSSSGAVTTALLLVYFAARRTEEEALYLCFSGPGPLLSLLHYPLYRLVVPIAGTMFVPDVSTPYNSIYSRLSITDQPGQSRVPRKSWEQDRDPTYPLGGPPSSPAHSGTPRTHPVGASWGCRRTCRGSRDTLPQARRSRNSPASYEPASAGRRSCNDRGGARTSGCSFRLREGRYKGFGFCCSSLVPSRGRLAGNGDRRIGKQIMEVGLGTFYASCRPPGPARGVTIRGEPRSQHDWQAALPQTDMSDCCFVRSDQSGSWDIQKFSQ